MDKASISYTAQETLPKDARQGRSERKRDSTLLKTTAEYAARRGMAQEEFSRRYPCPNLCLKADKGCSEESSVFQL